VIQLTGTSDLVQIIRSSTADVDVHASWVDLSGTTVTPGRTNNTFASAATSTIVGSPLSSTSRRVKCIHVRNRHAATANDITIQHYDGSTTVQLIKCTLAAGEALHYDEGRGWRAISASGGEKEAALPIASDTVLGVIEIAIQSEQESGSDATKAVTSGRQHFHPSAAKAWGMAVGAGTSLTVSYNITSVGDTGTGRLGVTIATDFSAATYAAVVTVQRSATSLAEAGVEDCAIRNASMTATAFEIESWDHTATTMVAQDPAQYYWACFGDQA
jgi:hypothetical protein